MMKRKLRSLIGHAAKAVAPNYVTAVRQHYRAHGDCRFFILPRTFNELIQYKKIFSRDPLLSLTSDKYKVRDYVKKKIGEEHLVPLVTVIDNPHLIDFDALPHSFVIKATHGSGFNFFVHDKKKIDQTKLKKTVAAWLEIDFAAYHGEWAYSQIERRLIIEEKLMPPGKIPDDYKFFVFNGRVRLIQLDRGRHANHRQNLYDETWRQLAVEYVSPRSSVPREAPAQLNDMINLAEVLAADFEFARIDLYLVDGKIFFGEITHYPNAGLHGFKPREFDYVLGNLWRSGAPIPDEYYLPEPGFPASETDWKINTGQFLFSEGRVAGTFGIARDLFSTALRMDDLWLRPSCAVVNKLPEQFGMDHYFDSGKVQPGVISAIGAEDDHIAGASEPDFDASAMKVEFLRTPVWQAAPKEALRR